MTPAQIRLMDSKGVPSWTTPMIQSLGAPQIGALSLQQIAALLPAQMAALTPAQLIVLTRDQAYALSATQLGALGKSQLAALNLDRSLLTPDKQAVLDKTLGIVTPLPIVTTPLNNNPNTNNPLLDNLRRLMPTFGPFNPNNFPLPGSPGSGGIIQSVTGVPNPVDQPFIVYGQ